MLGRSRRGSSALPPPPPPRAERPADIAPGPYAANGHEPWDVPRPIGVAAAARRHWVAVALPLVALTALMLQAGYARTPTFTAETRLGVGRLDPAVQGGLVGFTQATQALSERYGRTVRGDEVVRPVAAATGRSGDYVRAHISGAPIPQTPVFRIIATGSTPAAAVTLANATSRSVVRFSERESIATPTSSRYLSAYRKASALLAERREVAADKRQQDDFHETTRSRRALAVARAEVAAVELRVRVLREQYEASRRPPGPVALVRVLEQARGATSDRYKVLQLLLFVGVVGGGAAGLAFAVLLEARRRRRAT